MFWSAFFAVAAKLASWLVVAACLALAFFHKTLPPLQTIFALLALLAAAAITIALQVLAKMMKARHANPFSKMTRAETKFARAVISRAKAGTAKREDFEALSRIMVKYHMPIANGLPAKPGAASPEDVG